MRTYRQYLQLLNQMEHIATRVDIMRTARATATARAAGLGTERNVWTNAMISYENGTPWREVNYPLLRRALWLERTNIAHRIVDAWYRRNSTAILESHRDGAK